MALKSVMINGLLWMDRLRMGVKPCFIIFRFYLVIKQSLLVVIFIQFY